jgi:hypothetical protein
VRVLRRFKDRAKCVYVQASIFRKFPGLTSGQFPVRERRDAGATANRKHTGLSFLVKQEKIKPGPKA